MFTKQIQLLLLMGCILTSGIIRHDVNQKEYDDLAQQPQFDCVGQLMLNDTTPIGSCVLIGKNKIVTAAHCFEMAEEICKSKGVQSPNLSLYLKDQSYKINKYLIHPRYKKSHGRNSDIAMAWLNDSVNNVILALPNKEFDELNSEVVGVGYGVTGLANAPEKIQAVWNKKIAGQNVIDKIHGKKFERHPSILSCDFDHATDKLCNKMGSARPQPLEYISAGGDSGGGLFRFKNGQWELVGICAGGGINIETLLKTGYYGQIMDWTRVAIYASWLENEK